MVYDFDAPLNRRGTNCVKWDGLAGVFGKADLLPFWVADMDFRSAPEIIDALRGKVDFGMFGYPLMNDSAREAVANWQLERHGWKVDPSEVDFVPGVVTGLCAAVDAFTCPGDGVLVHTPVYPPFFSAVRDNGRSIVECPLKESPDRYEMDFERMESLLAANANVKAMILCNPHNPVARVWTGDELSRLADICVRRNIMIFSDEIHQDLVYRDAKHVPLSLAAPAADPLLLTLVAPSKTFNIAGICASAWIAKDGDVQAKMRAALGRLHIGSLNMLAAAALEAAYTKGAPWLDALLAYLEKNRDYTESFLKEKLPKVRLKHPEGTFIFWLDFRAYGLPPEEIQRILVEDAGVALNPGPNFGKEGNGFARFNIGCPMSQLEEGLSRIAAAFGAIG